MFTQNQGQKSKKAMKTFKQSHSHLTAYPHCFWKGNVVTHELYVLFKFHYCYGKWKYNQVQMRFQRATSECKVGTLTFVLAEPCFMQLMFLLYSTGLVCHITHLQGHVTCSNREWFLLKHGKDDIFPLVHFNVCTIPFRLWWWNISLTPSHIWRMRYTWKMCFLFHNKNKTSDLYFYRLQYLSCVLMRLFYCNY